MTWPKNVHPDYQWRATAQGSKGNVSIDCTEYPGTPFDELFLGTWFHLESMDRGSWWMSIAGYHFWVRVKRGGAVKVTHNGQELGMFGLEKDE